MAKKTKKFQPRKGEQVGGGFVIIARRKSDRVLVQTKGVHPYEHGSLQDAVEHAEKLAGENPTRTFHVFAQIRGGATNV